MRTDELANYAHDPVAFLDRYITRNELGQPFQLLPHQREVLRLAFAFDQHGRLPWDTVIYSCPKKSGKTTINAAITCWWAFTQEPPNELLIVANDLEQAQARVFKSLVGLLQRNRDLATSVDLQARSAIWRNGTTGTVISNDWMSGGGCNQGFESRDEAWAVISEGARRLWEELTPVPTRRNSIRFITTYAGWEGESDLLYGLYKLGVGPDEHPDGQGERLHPDLPVYANRPARLFVYWDHDPRMPWQTPQYYAAQRRTLRPGTYLRLHENRWTTAESAFITSGLWDQNVDPAHRPWLPTKEGELYVGVDAATKHDNASVVAVSRQGDRMVLVRHRIWKPSPSEPLNLEETIEAFVRELCEQFTVAAIVADPWQMARSIATLEGAGLPITEFPQTTANTTRMGVVLFDLLNGKNLCLYPSDELRQQALNAVAIETPRGLRIAKEKASKKIDAIVALSMACCAALDHPAREPLDLWVAGDRLFEEDVDVAQRLRDQDLQERARSGEEQIVGACRQEGYWWP